MVEKD